MSIKFEITTLWVKMSEELFSLAYLKISSKKEITMP